MSTIWLGKGIVSSLLQEAAAHGPLETGGVLLGWRSTGHICVTDIVGPGPDARHRKTAFEPDAEWQAGKIAQLYADSNQRLSYLGDWHTHPGAAPAPSTQDLQTLDAIAQHPPARCPQPVMVILGQPRTRRWVAAGYSVIGDRFPELRAVGLPLKIDEEIQGFSRTPRPAA